MADIRELVKEYASAYYEATKEIYNIINIDNAYISTDKCKIIDLYVHLDPKDPLYGHMNGAFEYDDHFYTFGFHIHLPNQRYAYLSNKMNTLEELEEYHSKVCPEIVDVRSANKTYHKFGKAFWMHTQDSDLETDALELRKLMRNLVAFSRKENFIGRLRKTDKQYLKLHGE